MVNPTDETKKMNEALDEANKHSKKLGGAFLANSKNLAKNTVAIGKSTIGALGLANVLGTVAGLIGKQTQMNETLSKSLVQAGAGSMRTADVMESVRGGLVGVEQAISTFGDAVQMGMAGFADGFLKFSAQLKAQGIDNKGVMALMRRNVQALGLTEESTLLLADSLVSTAAANKDSINGLVQAINSMKEALTKTTVELGPQAAANAQKIAAMMAQGNTELQEATTKFVTSFLAGSDGFMKAARLGVTFTGQETTAQMAAKFEEILSQIGGIQAGRRGTGSQFFFDAMERSFKLTREDFLLQKQIGNSIKDLVDGNTEARQQELNNISVTQAWQKATFEIQSAILSIMEGVATGISTLGEKLGGWFAPLLTSVGFLPTISASVITLGFGLAQTVAFILQKIFSTALGRVLSVAGTIAETAENPAAIGMGVTGAVVGNALVKHFLPRLLTAIGVGASLTNPVALIAAVVAAWGSTTLGNMLFGKDEEAAERDKNAKDARDSMEEAKEAARQLREMFLKLDEKAEAALNLEREQVTLARRRTRIAEAQFTGDAGSGPLQEISRFLIQNLAAQQQIIELTEAGNADRNNQRPGTTATNGFNF